MGGLRLNRLFAAWVLAVGLLAGAAPALACASAASQADCCPDDGSPCGDGTGASACCAPSAMPAAAIASAARAGLESRPDSGSPPIALIPAWKLNPAPIVDAGQLHAAGVCPPARHSQPVYLRTSRLRL